MLVNSHYFYFHRYNRFHTLPGFFNVIIIFEKISEVLLFRIFKDKVNSDKIYILNEDFFLTVFLLSNISGKKIKRYLIKRYLIKRYLQTLSYSVFVEILILVY